MVLGYIEQGNSKWLSQDDAMIVTHNGRLIHTLKLPYNLLEVTNLEHDPLRHTPQLRDGSQWSRDVRWQERGGIAPHT